MYLAGGPRNDLQNVRSHFFQAQADPFRVRASHRISGVPTPPLKLASNASSKPSSNYRFPDPRQITQPYPRHTSTSDILPTYSIVSNKLECWTADCTHPPYELAAPTDGATRFASAAALASQKCQPVRRRLESQWLHCGGLPPLPNQLASLSQTKLESHGKYLTREQRIVSLHELHCLAETAPSLLSLDDRGGGPLQSQSQASRLSLQFAGTQ